MRLAAEERDDSARHAKFNPLALWTEDDVWAYTDRHEVPYNALHDRGYPSIGCAPARARSSRARTRAPAAGGGSRADAQGMRPARRTVAARRSLRPGVPSDVAPSTCLALPQTAATRLDHLDWLESEAIHILREVAAAVRTPRRCSSPAARTRCVLLRLAEKAFRPGRFPFPLLHIDTGHNFPEVIAFRDARAAELGERLIVRSVEDSIARGRVVLRAADESRNAAQSVTLLDAIAEFGFDACIGGARRDEEKARAKERVFSFRDEFGQWDPKNQRPELWNLYNARVHQGEHVRVFPISNWTELDVWQYIERERLPCRRSTSRTGATSCAGAACWCR